MKNFLIKVCDWLGFTIPKKLEYNIPAESLEQKYYELIHADVEFTLDERIEILKAVQEWNVFCNGLIILDVVFDYWEGADNLPDPRATIIRATEETPVVKSFLEDFKKPIAGLCHYNGPTGPDMYLIHEKIQLSVHWRLVTQHEIGHYLGMNHVNGNAIMAPQSWALQKTFTELDAKEFATAYSIDPDQLVYAL